MIRKFCNERYSLLEEELSLISEMGIPPFKRLSTALASIFKTLEDLKAYILLYPFKDDEEEIYFFKYEKPRVLAHQIFLTEQFTIENQKPKEDAEFQLTYYQNELKFNLRFFEQYKFQYGYYQSDSTELDLNYFMRNAKHVSMIMPVLPDRDPKFSTTGDYLFAKFYAYEMLQEFIIKQIWELKHPNLDVVLNRRFKWTGEAINLVELAYGIWLTGQINNGNATITDIIEFLEDVFQVKIGRPFRRWTEISQRKMISPTKYIDQIKAEIQKRINDGNK
jgi:hypothetical protein